MMPVDQFIRQNKAPKYNPDFKSHRYYGHQTNNLFSIDTQGGEEDTPEEVCDCCKEKNEPLNCKGKLKAIK